MANDSIKCPSCGTQNSLDRVRCKICGTKLPKIDQGDADAQNNTTDAAAIVTEKVSKKVNPELDKDCEDGLVYQLFGARGRNMRVYEDRCEITTDVTVGSFITGNATDGEKTIFYADCVGIQFKRSGALIGFLQIETAAPTMNNEKSNFFNENAFTFTEGKSISNELMEEVYSYVKSRVSLYKHIRIPETKSIPEEIKKYKELLDCEAITEDEYQKKKKELLDI